MDRILVGNVQDASDRPSSDEVMVQVCIHIVHEGDLLSQKSWHVMWNNFFHVPIDSIGPVKLLVWQCGEVRLFGMESDSSTLHLDKL